VRQLREALANPSIWSVVLAFAAVVAVTGHARSRTAAESVVAERLGSG
jgi:hypothetical protein